MGFEMEYTLDGRRVTQRQFLDGLHKQAYDQAIASARARIESVRCPVHGQRATATLKNRRGDEFEFSISGCCEQLTAAAQRSL